MSLRLLAAVVSLGVALAAEPGPVTAQTVREVLREHRIAPGTLTERQLARSVNSYGIEDAADFFAIGFYDVVGNGVALPDTIHVYALDRATQRWTVAALSREQPLHGESRPVGAGSILDIHHTRTHVYIDTHSSPSAGIILVLSRDLKPVTALWGWTLRLLPNDVLVYHRSMVHFAPTHSAELWMYDARSKRDTVLYPRKPYSALRTRYVAQVKAVYDRLGEDWFRINNHHMDPEQFDSRREDSLVVSADGRSLATLILFGDRDTVPGRTPPLEIIVHCTSLHTTRPACTEEELAVVRRRYPGMSRVQLLTRIVN